MSQLGMGLAIAGVIGTVVLQSIFERQLETLEPAARDEVQGRLIPLWLAVGVVALAVGVFFILGKTRGALQVTVGILVANALVVAVHKHRVLGGVDDPIERARLRRTSLAQLAASVTMFGGAALYLLGGR